MSFENLRLITVLLVLIIMIRTTLSASKLNKIFQKYYGTKNQYSVKNINGLSSAVRVVLCIDKFK